jgi:hypothetical protein
VRDNVARPRLAADGLIRLTRHSSQGGGVGPVGIGLGVGPIGRHVNDGRGPVGTMGRGEAVRFGVIDEIA